MKVSSIIAVLAVIAAIGLGAVAYRQYAENIALKGQLAATSSPMISPTSTQSTSPSESVLAEKHVTVGSSNITIQSRCSGDIKKGVEKIGDPAEDVSFCIGDYELVATMGSQSVVIASGHAGSGTDSPVLLKAETIASSTDVLISYLPSCASTGDCGVGMPTNQVTFALHAKDSSVQSISHFPPNGTPVWNDLATKALFIPETCGGAGCDVAPVIGYDLTKDSSKAITNEKAVGLGTDGKASDATDPVGNRLPVWQSVQWNVGDTFSATLLKDDGSKQIVNGTF
jgi:hypothetical protein